MFDIVTLPIFVTVISKSNISPTAAKFEFKADFRISSSGAAVPVTVALSDSGGTASPFGKLASTDAVLMTSPASKSACVTV